MSNKIIVTTADLKNDYEVLGPIYFSLSNKGLFGSQLGTLIKKYKIDAVGFIPPTVKREVQLMKELEKKLGLHLLFGGCWVF